MDLYNVPTIVKKKKTYNKAIIQQKCLQGTLPLNISEKAPTITWGFGVKGTSCFSFIHKWEIHLRLGQGKVTFI